MTEPSMPERLWYIVHTYSGSEDRVIRDLRQRFEALDLLDRLADIRFPTEVVTEQKDGRSVRRDHGVFPGHILVKVAMSQAVIQLILTTPKVTGFVGGKRPTPLTGDEVDHMIGAQTGVGKRRATPPVGSRIRISGGPFAGFEGQVDHVDDDRATVRVTVLIVDRPTSFDLPYDQVEPVT